MSKIKVVAVEFNGMLILEELLKIISIEVDSVVIAKYETSFNHTQRQNLKSQLAKRKYIGLVE